MKKSLKDALVVTAISAFVGSLMIPVIADSESGGVFFGGDDSESGGVLWGQGN